MPRSSSKVKDSSLKRGAKKVDRSEKAKAQRLARANGNLTRLQRARQPGPYTGYSVNRSKGQVRVDLLAITKSLKARSLAKRTQELYREDAAH